MSHPEAPTAAASKSVLLVAMAVGGAALLINSIWYGNPYTSWLTLASYAPFLVWLQGVKRPFWWSYVFGLAVGLLNVGWTGFTVAKFLQASWLMPLASLAVASQAGIAYAVFIGAAIKWWRGNYALYAAAIFLAECCRMYFPQIEFPLGMWGSPLGAYGPASQLIFARESLAEVVAIVSNIVIAAQIVGKKINWWPICGALVALRIVAGMLTPPPPNIVPTRVGIAQVGVDIAFGEQRTIFQSIGRSANALIDRAESERVDALIFSEGMAYWVGVEESDWQRNTPFRLSDNHATIFGVRRGVGNAFTSSVMFLDNSWTVNDKKRLVAFGERVPYPAILNLFGAEKIIGKSISQGEKTSLFQIKNGLKMGSLVCFEALFESDARSLCLQGADVLVVQSMDDWFMGTGAAARLRVACQWRAMENRRTLLRSASLGETCVIGPDGTVKNMLPISEPGLLVLEMALPALK